MAVVVYIVLIVGNLLAFADVATRGRAGIGDVVVSLHVLAVTMVIALGIVTHRISDLRRVLERMEQQSTRSATDPVVAELRAIRAFIEGGPAPQSSAAQPKPESAEILIETIEIYRGMRIGRTTRGRLAAALPDGLRPFEDVGTAKAFIDTLAWHRPS